VQLIGFKRVRFPSKNLQIDLTLPMIAMPICSCVITSAATYVFLRGLRAVGFYPSTQSTSISVEGMCLQDMRSADFATD